MVRSPAALVGGSQRPLHPTSASSHNFPSAASPHAIRRPVTLPIDMAHWATEGLSQDFRQLPGWENYKEGCKRIQALFVLYTEKFDRQSGGLGALTPRRRNSPQARDAGSSAI